MMMEDHMEDHTDTHSLYVLVVSLLGTVISLPVVWYITEAAYAAPDCVRSCTGLEKVPLSISFSASACRGC
jgi:hypothetical protein